MSTAIAEIATPRKSPRVAARRQAVRRLRRALGIGLLGWLGCAREVVPPPEETTPVEASAATEVACPAGPVPAAFAPRVDASLERADTWLSRTTAPDRVLLDAAALAELRRRNRFEQGSSYVAVRDPWDAGPTHAQLMQEFGWVVNRYAHGLEQQASGIEVDGRILADARAVADARTRLDTAEAIDHARLVVAPTQLHASPMTEPVLAEPFDPAFDRNLTSTLHPGELVRVRARSDGGRWLLVDAGHSSGWARDDGLSARLLERDRIAWHDAERVWSLRDDVRTQGGVVVPLGVGLPLVGVDARGIRVRVATLDGPADDVLPTTAKVTVGFAPLRKDAVLDVAFAQIGAPYGWGGRAGARDCSQWLRDILMPFGVALPRHSSLQAMAARYGADVKGLADADKLAAIERAAEHGLVLLYMPGHVMLDLGAKDGTRWAISSIAEFLEPCPNGGATLRRLDRVAVTDLEVGRGTERGAFIERITAIGVWGSPQQ